MTTLSITAPQRTTEDDIAEAIGYSDEEKKEAQGDLLGTRTASKSFSEDDLQEFHRLLAEIPVEKKEEYLEAVDRAPILVETESPPELFLKTDSVLIALQRFINYWELRRWLFGERAWLPMTATGDGALSPEDVELLESGFCTILPQDDAYGRALLCFQIPAEKLNVERLAMARVVFYVLSLALWSRPRVAEHGMVVIFNARNFCMDRYDRKFIKCIAYLFTGWHPVVARAFHVTTPPGHKSCFSLILPYLRHFMTRRIRQRFQWHKGTKKECITALHGYGIQSHSLPIEMGGLYTKEQFREWLTEFIQPQEIVREENYVETLELDGYESQGSLMSLISLRSNTDGEDPF